MSKTDEMLTKQGYGIRYKEGKDTNIKWCIIEDDNAEIRIGSHELIFIEPKGLSQVILNTKTLQAINEKCKELGWIKEKCNARTNN